MSRAVNLANLADTSVIAIDSTNDRVGIGSTQPSEKLDVVGVVSATSFFGDGSNLSGITAGATLSAASGAQRVVVTSLTSGTMTAAGTDADLAWNSTTNTLSATNISVGGTLTYNDVTNIDSVGLITARTGIKVLANGINAVGVVTANSFAGYDSLQAGYFDIVSGPTPDPVIYNVTVASKDSTHRYFGQGSGQGYKINGVFSPWLTLTPGRKYRFLMSSSDMSAHPFRFYKEADKTTAYTTNVTSTATYTEILVTDSTPQILHYQCSLHGYMGNGASTLSNVSATQSSGIEVKSSGSSVGTSLTALNFSGATVSTGSAGITTITIAAAGITSAQSSPSANTVITLNLGTAQHHDLRLSAGISTITCTGGSAGESHSVVITQPSSGIAVVGFSTYFLFPSGSTPSMSEGGSKVDLISFVVKTEGSSGVATALLASAGLNYS